MRHCFLKVVVVLAFRSSRIYHVLIFKSICVKLEMHFSTWSCQCSSLLLFLNKALKGKLGQVEPPQVSNVDKSLVKCICSQSKLHVKNGLIPHGVFTLWFCCSLVVNELLNGLSEEQEQYLDFGSCSNVIVNRKPGGSLKNVHQNVISNVKPVYTYMINFLVLNPCASFSISDAHLPVTYLWIFTVLVRTMTWTKLSNLWCNIMDPWIQQVKTEH